MASAASYTTFVNPTATNLPVALTTGVVQDGTGIGGPFVLDLYSNAYTSAAMVTKVTGSPVSVVAQLQGSLDGVNWTVIATSTSTTGDTQLVAASSTIFSMLRVNISATSGGTNPTIAVSLAAFTTPAGSTTVAQGSANTSITLGWPVAQGAINPITSLNAATTTVTGTVADFQSARNGGTFQVVASTGTTAGAVTVLGSVDGTSFATLTTAVLSGATSGVTLASGVLTFTAPSTALVSLGANSPAIRYLRADVTTNMTGGTVTAKILGF